MDLIILAGGNSSRFGNLKQLYEIDDNKNFIMDYSIFDAINTGFNRVILVIKKENYLKFKRTIGKRLENKIEVKYVFQNNLAGRDKPLGTAHALLCCKELVNNNFAVINADDFYGPESFKILAKFLKEKCSENNYATVCFKALNTLSNNGEVKRGIILKEGKKITKIEECLLTTNTSKITCASSLEADRILLVNNKTFVSVNMFAFNKNIFKHLEKQYKKFLEKSKNQENEFMLPTVLNKLIKEKKVNITALKTTDNWLGLTYKDDEFLLKKQIALLKLNKTYPTNLWH